MNDLYQKHMNTLKGADVKLERGNITIRRETLNEGRLNEAINFLCNEFDYNLVVLG